MPTVNLTGRVYNEKAQPRVGLTVEAYDNTVTGSALASTTTDANGEWSFENLSFTNGPVNIKIIDGSQVRWILGLTKAMLAELTLHGQLVSMVPEGVAPFIVASTTLVTNLNADKLDGRDAGNADGQIPVSNGNVNINLNADKLDGQDASAFATAGHGHPVPDHGTLPGLGDDDHSQYVHKDVARTITAQHTFQPPTAGAAPFAVGTNGTGVVTRLNADKLDGQDASAFASASHGHDHGTLTGLGDDDHSQYLHVSTARTVSARHTFQPPSPGQSPFIVGSNGTGVVANLNVDRLDSKHASDFADVNHVHEFPTSAHWRLAASSVVNLSTSNQDVPGCSLQLAGAIYLVRGTFDFLSSTDGGDNNQAAIGVLSVGTDEQPGFAVFSLGNISGVRLRGTVSQEWVVDLSSAGIPIPVKLQVRKGGGTGNSQCINLHTTMTVVRIG